ncbi:MAG: hypothetical protein EOS28_31405 [Mesorhizobium sp.]|nr:MAG: hypothetical protein EOS28_31405 [Mesorhizobium sp.]
MRLQATLKLQIAAGKVPKDAPSPSMMEATAHMLKAWGVWKHRLAFYDKPLVARRFNEMLHSVFVIEGKKPTIAASSFFSVDNKPWGKAFSAATLNVIPLSDQFSAVIVSYPKGQSGLARRYVAPIFTKAGDERLFELSYLLVDRAENFFISPSHLEAWSDEKRKLIESSFVATIVAGQPAERDQGLMLF